MSENRLLNEVAPGIFDWEGRHPSHGAIVHSHYLAAHRAVIDPIGADGLSEELEAAGGVEHVLLSNRHHQRGSEEICDRFECDIRVPRAGLREFEDPDRPDVVAYDWGEEVLSGITAHEVGSLAPDDGAFHVAGAPGALVLADSLIRDEEGLGFVSDSLMDDPEGTKDGLLEALGKLARIDFDVLLLAHGAPYGRGGREALEQFLDSPRTASMN